ncbi:MAG: ATP-NAD kinase [Chloroflexi bacterium]|nr:ATP-NAD kinase [Chloroflexota bacterium]
MSKIVGIIANPAAGKDIRRLVAQAATVADHAKVSIVAQALAGLGAVGIERALIMPDLQQLGNKASQRLQRGQQRLPEVDVLDGAVKGTALDSTHAAQEMRIRGAGAIIVLGGDGTARAVSKGAGEVPLLCVSTGTNNVLPVFVEGTIAGMAAGVVALGLVARDAVACRSKWLGVAVDGRELDLALVDVGLLKSQFVGAAAVWSMASLRHLWVTRAEAHSVGLTSIAATQGIIGPRDPWGRWVTLGTRSETGPLAVLAPGLVEPTNITASHELWKERPSAVELTEPGALALDGEREHMLRAGAHLQVTLHLDGPWLIDPQAAMRAWAELGLQQLNDRGDR